MDQRLNEIQEYLVECGIQSVIYTDRVEPYVNIGEVKHVKNRVQFWAPKNNEEVHMFIGKEMGRWYEESGKSIYLNKEYRYSFKENKVEFPNVEMAKSFISIIKE